MENKIKLVILTISVLFLGCSADDTGSETVQPMEDILFSGPEFTNIGPNSASALIDTRISVVCAAVYGKTTDYGKIATDADMMGGAHRNHSPLLTGLEPATTYHVRFQGTGPDGTLYRSEDYTFTTSDADTRPEGENMALLSEGAKVTAVSSIFGGGGMNSAWGGNNAIDGDPNTEWSSNGDGDDAWIEVELPEKVQITQIGLWTRTMGNTGQIESFQVVVGEEYGAKGTYGPFTLEDASRTYYFDTNFSAKKLRFEVLESTGGNTGVVEIEVYTDS
ncbi:MAG: discoidin domain-containing protein [Archaeoglobaceae archaeon]